MINIPSKQKLRIASLNLSSTTSSYIQRVEAVFKEGYQKNIDVLLLQEVTHCEKETIRTLAADAGYEHSYISPSLVVRQFSRIPSSTAIFSRHPLANTNEMSLTAINGATKAAYGTVEFNGNHVLVMSVHLLRGAENGYIRLKQATLIEELAARSTHDRANAIVGGTFNDVPDGDSVRYLLGRKTSNNVKSAFWIDATENTPLADTATTRYQSELGKEAAQQSGIHFPELIPERKVDYLFTRGWVYGTVGMPLDAALFGTSIIPERGISDHYGVMSDFWFPEK